MANPNTFNNVSPSTYVYVQGDSTTVERLNFPIENTRYLKYALDALGLSSEGVLGAAYTSPFKVGTVQLWDNAGTLYAKASAPASAGDGVGLAFTAGVLAITGAVNITSASATAFTVGANGTTNPVLSVVANVASVATGVSITGHAAAARVNIAVLSSGTDEGISIDAKGAGTIRLGATSTGAVEFSRNAVPTATGGAALGTTSLMWSGICLAAGAAINYNNGVLTLTNSASTLILAGASTPFFQVQDTTTPTTLSLLCDDTTGIIRTETNHPLLFGVNTVERMRLLSGGALLVGTGTANTKMTQGITIQANANTGESGISFKSTSVAHGVTNNAETDTCGFITRNGSTAGGLQFNTFYTGAGPSSYFYAVASAPDSAHSAAGIGVFQSDAAKKSGTAAGACAAGENIFVAGNNGQAQFIVDGAGNIYANGGSLSTTMVTLYDEFDDVGLLIAFDRMRASDGGEGFIEREWEQSVSYNEKTLIELGLLGGPRVGIDPSQRGLINYTGMIHLHNGAIRQVFQKVMEQADQIAWLESELLLLSEKN